MSKVLSEIENTLKSRNQIKLLLQLQNLKEDELKNLSEQIKSIPWNDYSPKDNQSTNSSTESFTSSKIISLKDRAFKENELSKLGLEAYKNGEVAILMVAGGQGTRLGYSSPKGCFQIGAVSKKSLYQIHSEKVLALSLKFGHRIPFLIMTSEATDTDTKNFFEANQMFGLTKEQVEFFSQASIPSFDLSGNLLLSKPGELLRNPDGHGGCFTALIKGGYLNQLKTNGIKHIIYIQVDNVLAPVFDPFLIGLAISEQADVITKVVEKRSADEKVGLLVSMAVTKVIEKDGVTVTQKTSDTIKEYIELPKEILEEKDQDGRLKYRAGNTAMHYWNLNFLTDNQEFNFPLHASKKPLKVWQNNSLEMVEGYKYERFIFDLIPRAKVSIGLEVDRNSEFAPLKNSTGVDSPESVNKSCSNLFKSWVKQSGVNISSSLELEISPLLAMDQQSLSHTLAFDIDLKKKIESSIDKIYID